MREPILLPKCTGQSNQLFSANDQNVFVICVLIQSSSWKPYICARIPTKYMDAHVYINDFTWLNSNHESCGFDTDANNLMYNRNQLMHCKALVYRQFSLVKFATCHHILNLGRFCDSHVTRQYSSRLLYVIYTVYHGCLLMSFLRHRSDILAARKKIGAQHDYETLNKTPSKFTLFLRFQIILREINFILSL